MDELAEFQSDDEELADDDGAPAGEMVDELVDELVDESSVHGSKEPETNVGVDIGICEGKVAEWARKVNGRKKSWRRVLGSWEWDPAGVN